MNQSSSTPKSAASPATFTRIDYPRAPMYADANCRHRYPADAASWIWHPTRLNETAFLRFTLDFELEKEERITLQVSGDQRFQMSVDGVEFAYGPDRSDEEHWSLQTYEGRLPAGRHTFSALVWWIADIAFGVPSAAAGGKLEHSGRYVGVPTPPMAQCSFRGGFLVAALGGLGEKINTGSAPWKIEDRTDAVHLARKEMYSYHDIGSTFTIDAEKWRRPVPSVAPLVVRVPIGDGKTGVAQAGWRLETTPIPEQLREIFSGGKIRETSKAGDLEKWQALVSGASPLRVEANQSFTLLWDLADYRCGYPVLEVSGGRGATVDIDWAEALYETDEPSKVGGDNAAGKGHRDKTAGKLFFGFGDRFICDGSDRFTFPSFWWRAGRFIEIRVVTGAEPLVIEKLAIKTTRYPLEWEGTVSANDPLVGRIADLAVNTMKAGTHEVFADSPCYEQLPYIGDNLIECLVVYMMTGDTRMTRRAIELFDWSRSVNGLVTERWPSALHQGCTTYAMLWIAMVRNHAWWRDEPDFIRERLIGVRHLIEELCRYRETGGLLGRLPGWSFVDWVAEWDTGYPPGHENADSSLVHMHWLLCLQQAAELETHFGEPEFAQRLRRLEREAAESIVRRYCCDETGLFYDDGSRKHLSEHANALASMLGLRKNASEDWPAQLQARKHAQCSVYFNHYLLEAACLERKSDAFFSRLDLWRSFLDCGFITLPESFEPSRSDCHAWGTHPLYHFHASVAGIRPASPGFRTVSVKPMLGPLENIEGELPHPAGEIKYSIRKKGAVCEGAIKLPAGVTGTLELGGSMQNLVGGENTFRVTV